MQGNSGSLTWNMTLDWFGYLSVVSGKNMEGTVEQCGTNLTKRKPNQLLTWEVRQEPYYTTPTYHIRCLNEVG